MKKVLSLILALTLVFALAVPVLAENTVINQDSIDKTGETSVSYTVSPKYTITIPDTLTLTADEDRVLTGNVSFSVAAGSLINANQSLKLAITDATNYNEGFYLQNGSKADVKLSYTIANAESEGTAIVKDVPFLTASASDAFTGKTQSLYLTSGAYTQAGTYSDTLTITVTIV